MKVLIKMVMMKMIMMVMKMMMMMITMMTFFYISNNYFTAKSYTCQGTSMKLMNNEYIYLVMEVIELAVSVTDCPGVLTNGHFNHICLKIDKTYISKLELRII